MIRILFFQHEERIEEITEIARVSTLLKDTLKLARVKF